MARRNASRKRAIALSTTLLVALATFAPTTVGPAGAQEVIRRVPAPGWSIFDMFAPRRERVRPTDRFPDPPSADRPQRAAPSQKPRKPKTRVVARPAAATAPTTSPPQPEVVVVEKKPDARNVVMIGDFMASGVAEALMENFADNANVRVVDRAQGSSGFVRQDVYDWPKQIASVIDAEKPAAIVILMGSNDRQPMKIGDRQEPARSDAWTKEYQNRASALGETIEARKTPLLWVSVPAFKSEKMTSDMLAFNTIYKATAEAAGGEFVDVWDGFVDENGQFVSVGPDVNGQPVRLRGQDGINLTKAGKAKIAFYVEKPLRSLLGEREDGAPAIALPTLPDAPGAPAAIDRTEPISLNDPRMDGDAELLGAPAKGATLPGDPLASAAAPQGRADDFQPAGAPAPVAQQPIDPVAGPVLATQPPSAKPAIQR